MTVIAEPTPKRWTKAEYHGLLDFWGENSTRYELIDGEIIQMPPQKDEHAFALRLVDYVVRDVFKTGFVISIQMPLDLSATSEPEPDIAVVKGDVRSLKKHPRTAALIIEISGASLDYDRQTKGSLYASRGIADYWIVNLEEGTLEVYRRPAKDGSARFGYSYADTKVLRKGDTISPLAAAKTKIKVAKILP
jgi:Uma2 family endonuclease